MAIINTFSGVIMLQATEGRKIFHWQKTFQFGSVGKLGWRQKPALSISWSVCNITNWEQYRVNIEPNHQQTKQKTFRGKDGKVIIPNRKHINQAWKMFFERHRKNYLFQEARLFFYASTDSPLSLAKTLWSGNGRSCIVLNWLHLPIGRSIQRLIGGGGQCRYGRHATIKYWQISPSLYLPGWMHTLHIIFREGSIIQKWLSNGIAGDNME